MRGGGAAPALLTGVLLALALPPFHVLPAAAFGLVPLLVWIGGARGAAAGWRRAAAAGGLAGIVAYGILLHWVLLTPAVPLFHALAAFVTACAVPVAAAAAAAAATHALVHRAGLRVMLAAPVAWTAAEWARGRLGAWAVPWLELGTALAEAPMLAGIAELAGASGLAFWLVLLSGAAAELVLAARERANISRRRGASVGARLAGLTAVALLPAAYGVWRGQVLETVATTRLLLAPTERGRGPESAGGTAWPEPGSWRSGAEGAPVVVILPEMALPVPLERDPAAAARLAAYSAGAGLPVAAGAYGGGARLRNSVYLAGPAGAVREVYAKRRLVPVLEGPALGAAAGTRLARAAGLDTERYGGLEAGRGAGIVAVGEARLGLLICFESAFAALALADRRAGALVLVNPTNDGWFAPGRSGGWGAAQHLAHLTLRAVETRAGAVRVANAGPSAVIDPRGRRTLLLPAGAEPVVVEVATAALPPYVALGDALGPATLVLAVLVLALGSRLDRPRRLRYLSTVYGGLRPFSIPSRGGRP
jgi:apolipoprotein N-acyltransferase